MRALAKIRQQLQAQQYVLVAVRPHVDLAAVVMVIVPPTRGLVRVRPDRILSCWCPPSARAAATSTAAFGVKDVPAPGRGAVMGRFIGPTWGVRSPAPACPSVTVRVVGEGCRHLVEAHIAATRMQTTGWSSHTRSTADCGSKGVSVPHTGHGPNGDGGTGNNGRGER